MAKYIEEFLYRGRPPGSDQEPAWHVNIGDTETNTIKQFNMATAIADGWSLPSIIAEINEAAVSELSAALALATQLQAEVENVEQDKAAVAAHLVRAQQQNFEMQAIVAAVVSTSESPAPADPE